MQQKKLTMLPAGYKFLPTDEELFLHYLQPKVSGSQMPVNVIPEIDLQNYDPTHLQGICLNDFFKIFWVLV